MALPASALVKGLVGRFLPPANLDSQAQDVPLRIGRYGDQRIENAWPTDHLLADEGAYMVATTLPGATALQLGVSAAFNATLAACVIGNSDAPGGKRIYLRSLRLAVLTAPASGVDLRYAVVVDSKDRTPVTMSNGAGGSGPGTPGAATAYRNTVVCTNQDVNPLIVGVPFFPLSQTGSTPFTVPSAGQFARTIVGNGTIKGSIPVIKDQYNLTFGAVDPGGGTFQAGAALAKITENAPAVVIGPGQFVVIYLWSASNAVTGIAFDDMSLAWVEK